MPAEELGALTNPPMAGLLEYVVGPWGAVLVNIAVIVSLGGALFSYTILCVDSAYGPAEQGAFPPVFSKLNKFKSTYMVCHYFSYFYSGLHRRYLL